MVEYLEKEVVEMKNTPTPQYGMTAEGYSCQSGAPTSWLIRLEGEKIWRRLMVWQYSNIGTLFVRVKGIPLVVREYDLPSKEV